MSENYSRSGGEITSLGRYLNEIGQIPLLDAAEEVSLAHKIQAGSAAEAQLVSADTLAFGGLHALAALAPTNPETQETIAKMSEGITTRQDEIADGRAAHERFVLGNLRLVVSIAKRVYAPKMPRIDLIQEGNIALSNLVPQFDPEKGFRFSTFATKWLYGAMSRVYANQGSLIRLPDGSLRSVQEQEMTDPEGLALPSAEGQRKLFLLSNPVSIDSPKTNDGTMTVGDGISDPNAVAPESVVGEIESAELINLAFGSVTTKQGQAISLYCGLEDGITRTFEEVGLELGITHQAAGRLVRDGLERLRNVPTLKERYEASSDLVTS